MDKCNASMESECFHDKEIQYSQVITSPYKPIYVLQLR